MLQRLHLTLSPDQGLVALAAGSHTVRVWTMPQGEEVDALNAMQRLPERGAALEISTGHAELLGMYFVTNRALLCAHADGVLQLFMIASPEALDSGEALVQARSVTRSKTFRDLQVGVFRDHLASSPLTAHLSPQLAAILCWELDLEVRLKSADFTSAPSTGALYAGFGGVGGEVLWVHLSPSFYIMTRRLGQLASCVNVTTLSEDGALMASSCRDHTVAVWRPLDDLERAVPWRVFVDAEAEIWALDFAHSGRALCGGGIDNALYLWELEPAPGQRALTAKRHDHSGWISDVAWSHQDRVIASASWDNSVGVYRGSDLMPLYRLEIHQDYVSRVLFLPGSALLVTAGYDKRLAIWDWSQASLVALFEDHDEWIQGLCLGAAGTFLSASSDRHVIARSSTPPAALLQLTRGEEAASKTDSRLIEALPPTAPSVSYVEATGEQGAASQEEGGPLALEQVLELIKSPAVLSAPAQDGDVQTLLELPERFSPPPMSALPDPPARPLSPPPPPSEPREATNDSLRFEGASLTSGRLRSPFGGLESGLYHLQERSLAADGADVLSLLDAQSSSIVMIASERSELFERSEHVAPLEPVAARTVSARHEASPEAVSRGALAKLFKRHLDGEPLRLDGDGVSERELQEASVEEVTRSLFGDLTEVFEDSFQHYLKVKERSEASEPVEEPATAPERQFGRAGELARTVIDLASPASARRDVALFSAASEVLATLPEVLELKPIGRELSSPSLRGNSEARAEDESLTSQDDTPSNAAIILNDPEREEALFEGIFADVDASMHAAFASEIVSKEGLTTLIDESFASHHPPSLHALDDDEALPSADDAPTMNGPAHDSIAAAATLSPAMTALLASEEQSDSWYLDAEPVQIEERTVARIASADPLDSFKGAAHAERFHRLEQRGESTSSGKPSPQEPIGTQGDQPPPERAEERSGAAPLLGRPEEVARLVTLEDSEGSITSFGGIVYSGIEIEPEAPLGGNEITADASPPRSEPSVGTEFIASTPNWEVIEVAQMWQLRHLASRSAMKIFRRRASVSRQPWQRLDPVRAGLHNVFALCSRGDAEYFAAGGAARHLSVWSMNEELLHQLPATGRIIYALTATPDGRILISGDDRAHIDLWFLSDEEISKTAASPSLKRARLDGHAAPISSLSINTSGRLLFSACLDGTARLWNLEEGGCVSVLDHYGESLSACGFWGSGLASVSLEGVLRLWDRRGIQIDLIEGFSPLTCLVAKRHRIYFGSSDGHVHCYERGQTRLVGQHDAEVTGMSMHLDGTLISASRDGSIKIHYEEGRQPTTLAARAPLTCIDFDRGCIYAGTENGNIEMFRQT